MLNFLILSCSCLRKAVTAHGDDTSANPHHLLFVVLAYADLVQIVTRFGPEANISV